MIELLLPGAKVASSQPPMVSPQTNAPHATPPPFGGAPPLMPPQLLPGVPGDALFFTQHAKQLSTKDNGVFLLDEIGSSDSLSMGGSAAASQSVGSATLQYVRSLSYLKYIN